jgi:hypothetical protein
MVSTRCKRGRELFTGTAPSGVVQRVPLVTRISGRRTGRATRPCRSARTRQLCVNRPPVDGLLAKRHLATIAPMLPWPSERRRLRCRRRRRTPRPPLVSPGANPCGATPAGQTRWYGSPTAWGAPSIGPASMPQLLLQEPSGRGLARGLVVGVRPGHRADSGFGQHHLHLVGCSPACAGVLKAQPMFARLTHDAIDWADGKNQQADPALWCSGVRPALRRLQPLGLRGLNGRIRHWRPIRHPSDARPAGLPRRLRRLDRPSLSHPARCRPQRP